MLQVFSELDGKDINEVISEGMGKLASMPSGTATLQSFYLGAQTSTFVPCVSVLTKALHALYRWCRGSCF